jgi:hypothetical protein
VAMVTDRNFYDRYFFNGYSPDGSLFFGGAMGFYPALDVVDAAFALTVDGVQHQLRASGRLSGERMRLESGPIRIIIDKPLMRVGLSVGQPGDALVAELWFEGRHFPIEEPRFTRRQGSRLFMDYTRMTQNGRWTGWVEVEGRRRVLGPDIVGTRDRSWGIRPVGAPDAQPAIMPGGPQFFWFWTPCNFAGHSLFLHSNDDAAGVPWNRRAALMADLGTGTGDEEWDAPEIALSFTPGTRRIQGADIRLGPDSHLTLTPRKGAGALTFYMHGLGYTHPTWGHGSEHGDAAVAMERLVLQDVADNDPAQMHVQVLSDAVLEHGGQQWRGVGVFEQLFIGPHAPTGLTGLFDPAGGETA